MIINSTSNMNTYTQSCSPSMIFRLTIVSFYSLWSLWIGYNSRFVRVRSQRSFQPIAIFVSRISSPQFLLEKLSFAFTASTGRGKYLSSNVRVQTLAYQRSNTRLRYWEVRTTGLCSFLSVAMRYSSHGRFC